MGLDASYHEAGHPEVGHDTWPCSLQLVRLLLLLKSLDLVGHCLQPEA